MSISWNNELELTLLECYQVEPILWQSKHKDHKNKNKVHDAWTRISTIMDIPVPELKKKKESLMSSYRSYRKKVKDSSHRGAGSEEIYKPIWFAYEIIDSFLGEGVQACSTTINTEESSSVRTNQESSSVHVNEEETNFSGNVHSQPTVGRRHLNPTNVLAAGEEGKDALSTLKTTLNTWRIEEDDECDLHGKVIAKKLRKLPENERMQFVCEIYKMFIRRDQLNESRAFSSIASPSPSPTYSSNYMQIRGSQTKSNPEPVASYKRAHSSHSSESESPIYYSSIPEIIIPDQCSSPKDSSKKVIGRKRSKKRYK